jgi:RecA-family ATPase
MAQMGDERAPKFLAQFTRADLVEVKPVDWLIEGWIAKDTLAGMVGPSGSCKSFLAIDWACRVATGTPWYGQAVERGAVFILAGEGRNGLRKRIEGWSVHNGVSIAGAPLYLASTLPKLTCQLNAAVIIAEIDAMVDHLLFENRGAEPALVVIDTVARAMAGENENSSEIMGALVEAMDWIRSRWPGCVVLSIHHTGHDSRGRARGSSAYYAALDSEVVLKPVSDDVQLHATKAKDWEPARPLQLSRHRVDITLPGTEVTSSTLVLVNTGATPASVAAAMTNEVRAMHESGKPIRKIAEETGLSKSKVERLLKRHRPVWEETFDDPIE